MKVHLRVISGSQTYVGEVDLHPVEPVQNSSRDAKEGAEARGVATMPSQAVRLLYSRGFFGVGRLLPETSNELRKGGYNFSNASISMALRAAEFLQVRGKRGAYMYIQKYPPAGIPPGR